MCYGSFCRTVDPDIPLLCPECMIEQFYSLTEEELAEMYEFVMEDDDVGEEAKEIFFVAFNKLLLLKGEQLKPTKGD